MNNTRREFLLGSGALCATGASLWAKVLPAAARGRKNILFIMTDDHAAHAISAYGSKINRTPNIDRLATEGMIFSDVLCTNPICAPSRAGILTGCYSHKNGVPSFVTIPKDRETVGGYLKKAGYYTAFIGKWHLGGPNSVRDEDWNTWKVYAGQGVYFDPFFFTRGKDGKIVKEVYKGEYATENLTKVCQKELDVALGTGKPFFMMMHHKAPHRNWLPSEKYRASFRALTLKDIPMPETIFDDFKGRASPIKTTAMTLLRHMRPGADLKLAEFFGEGHTFSFEGKTYEGRKDAQGAFVDDWPMGMDDRAKIALAYLRYMQDYLACVQSVDDSVGAMIDYLKAKGVWNDTLVIYTSDQGFFLGDHGLYDKRFMMEETLKMPFLASCPSLIKPGSVNGDLITNIDFAPTFLDIAGAKKPKTMQGDSFLSNLAGVRPRDWKDACYCRYYVEGGEHQTAAWYGVRTKTDKLIFYYKRNEWEYFDLKRDPEEVRNGYADPKYATRIAQLKKTIAELRRRYQDDDAYANCGEYSL